MNKSIAAIVALLASGDSFAQSPVAIARGRYAFDSEGHVVRSGVAGKSRRVVGDLRGSNDALHSVEDCLRVEPLVLCTLFHCGELTLAECIDDEFAKQTEICSDMRSIHGLVCRTPGPWPGELHRAIAIATARRNDVFAAAPYIGSIVEDVTNPLVARLAASRAVRTLLPGDWPLENEPAAQSRIDKAILCPFEPDLVCSIRPEQLPAERFVRRGLERKWNNWFQHELLRSGASLSPGQALGVALAAEVPRFLPYELARRFGNWRVESAALALRFEPSKTLMMARVRGNFDTARITGALHEYRHPDGDGRFALLGVDVRVSSSLIEIVSHGLPAGGRHRVQLDDSPAFLRANRRALGELSLADASSLQLEVTDGRARSVVEFDDIVEASAFVDAVRASLQDPDDDRERGPFAVRRNTVRQRIRNGIEIEREGSRVEMACALDAGMVGDLAQFTRREL